eukprot:1923463-Heterocapsa_arctica.AAC.1
MKEGRSELEGECIPLPWIGRDGLTVFCFRATLFVETHIRLFPVFFPLSLSLTPRPVSESSRVKGEVLPHHLLACMLHTRASVSEVSAEERHTSVVILILS